MHEPYCTIESEYDVTLCYNLKREKMKRLFKSNIAVNFSPGIKIGWYKKEIMELNILTKLCHGQKSLVLEKYTC
jgi:hypothetical protein